jgi:hypothetical protein
VPNQSALAQAIGWVRSANYSNKLYFYHNSISHCVVTTCVLLYGLVERTAGGENYIRNKVRRERARWRTAQCLGACSGGVLWTRLHHPGNRVAVDQSGVLEVALLVSRHRRRDLAAAMHNVFASPKFYSVPFV